MVIFNILICFKGIIRVFIIYSIRSEYLCVYIFPLPNVSTALLVKELETALFSIEILKDQNFPLVTGLNLYDLSRCQSIWVLKFFSNGSSSFCSSTPVILLTFFKTF